MPGSALSNVQKFFPEVTCVMDATSSTTLEITKGDIANANRRQHKTCAMAVACKRAMKADGVIIALTTAYCIFGRKALRYKLQENTSREIVAFDRDGAFKPGVYLLQKPRVGHRLGNPGGHALKTGKSKRVRPYHHTSGIRTILGSTISA